MQTLSIHLFDKKGNNPLSDLSSHRYIGKASFALSTVFSYGAEGLKLVLLENSIGERYESPPVLYVVADTTVQSRLQGYIQFSAQNIPRLGFIERLVGPSDYSVELVRAMDNQPRFVVVSTESVHSDDPTWRVLRVPIGALVNGDWQQHFFIQIRDLSRNRIVAQTRTSLGEIFPDTETPAARSSPYNAPQRTFTLQEPPPDQDNAPTPPKDGNYGTITIQSFMIRLEFPLTDYLQSGLQFHLTMGYDFTASNGDSRAPRSLHYINPKSSPNNPYITLTRSIGSVLQNYVQSDNISAYGFAGHLTLNPAAAPSTHPLFPLTLNEQTVACQGVESLVSTYIFAVQHVRLSGPSFFCPLLDNVATVASRPVPQGFLPLYHMLLILTDGAPDDYDQFLAKIALHSDKPLSVIVIGIGIDELYDLNVLNAPSFTASDGSIPKRRCSFYSFFNTSVSPSDQLSGHSADAIAKDATASVAEQVLSFMLLHNIAPPGLRMLDGDYKAVTSSSPAGHVTTHLAPLPPSDYREGDVD